MKSLIINFDNFDYHMRSIDARTVRFCKTFYFNNGTINTRISSHVKQIETNILKQNLNSLCSLTLCYYERQLGHHDNAPKRSDVIPVLLSCEAKMKLILS